MNETESSHLYTPRERHGHGRRKSRPKPSSSLKRSHSHHDVTGNTSSPSPPLVELSVDNRAPGLLKIFGEFVVVGAQYKSVLASMRSTAQELIKQALERYGLPQRLYRDFVLCESIGAFVTDKTTSSDGGEGGDNEEADSISIKKRTNQRLVKTRHTFHRLRSKFVDDRSPCGSPRAADESPRTPLGSPRTPCGSPSTVRESPRVRPGDSEQQDIPWNRFSVNDAVERPSLNQWKAPLRTCQDSRKDSVGIDHRLNSPGNFTGVQLCDNDYGFRGVSSVQNGVFHWIPISVRVLIPSDRPLELQEFWKPPEGFSRRYELRRRCDVTMESVDNETLGLNDNARRIMISKLSPGVIPYSSQHQDAPPESRTILKDEWNKAAGTRNLAPWSTNEHAMTNVVEGDPRQAYVCPSIYPYLLTLRGCSIQKDLVLYPLKSLSLAIGSAEKTANSDNIKLSSEDISPSHCRVTLKRLPQYDAAVSEDKRQYWYCLDLDIFGSSFVTVNGVQVKQKATVYPGDLLGIGRKYLFLYKDPTGGHDIPSAVPWLPEQELEMQSQSLQSHLHSNHNVHNANSNSNNNNNNVVMDHVHASLPSSNVPISSRGFSGDHLDELDYNEEDSYCLDDSSSRNTPIFLAYHKDKELELLESIAEVKCHTSNSYPLTHSLLFLASHQYAVRKFPGDHQTTFFKRLARVVKARLGVVSRAMAHQRQESAIFHVDQSGKSSPSDTDHFPCLVNWLSNIVSLMAHFRMPTFQADVSNLARRGDVTSAVLDVVACFENSTNFLFQQTVYNVTKVLYDPINKFMDSTNPGVPEPSPPAIQRILSILQTVRRLATDVMLSDEVANQLMVYLLFFVSTTLFNRIITKGARLYNHESGSRLHKGLSELEAWAAGEALDVEFVRVSEHILSMVDLLSSSKRTLMKLDWHSFQTQFSPLTDVQLCKLLSEYSLGDALKHPDAWLPPYPIDTKEELTISLSSHPPFFLPQQGNLINLCETFPPAFYRHLEQVQQKFSLVGEDVYCSGLSSAGNTPRLSESFGRGGNISTFFSQDLGSSLISTSRDPTKGFGSTNPNTGKRTPPPPPPKPFKGPKTFHGTETHEKVGSIQTMPPNSQQPPPYNIAVKHKKMATNFEAMPKPTKSGEPERKIPFVRPIVIQHGTSGDFGDTHHNKQLQLNGRQINVLPNMSDLHLLQSKSRNASSSLKHKRLPNQSSQSSDNYERLTQSQSHPNNVQLSSSYPANRLRPSSATDCVHSSLSDNDWPGISEVSVQKGEHFRRSNSALGHRHNDPQDLQFHSQRQGPGLNITNKKWNMATENSLSLDYERNIKHPLPNNTKNHALTKSHLQGTSSRDQNNNNSNSNNGNVQNQGPIGKSFAYGSLKRSPRNMDLSRQSSSEIRITTEELANSHGQEDDGDQPPPLPPRGEGLRRQSSAGSRSPLMNSHNGSRRDSPQDPMLSSLSSSYRPRSGSRTSVEIQDITENQYIIYNPESPVTECFEHSKMFLPADHPSRSGQANTHTLSHNMKPAAVFTENKTQSQVPPLELPDDLLGVSETDSIDGVFTTSLGKDYNRSPHSYVHSLQKQQQQEQQQQQQQQRRRSDRLESSGSYPDDIYIDVQDFDLDGSSSGVNTLKVLPLDHTVKSADSSSISVRYRHSMPDARDITPNGEVTGEVFAVTLNKVGSKLGMGLIDGLHTPLKLPGIFVRNVLPDTPAALCGRIRVGDKIVAVNGKSIIGSDYDSAMRLIRSEGPQLNLLVTKCDRSVASKISASSA